MLTSITTEARAEVFSELSPSNSLSREFYSKLPATVHTTPKQLRVTCYTLSPTRPKPPLKKLNKILRRVPGRLGPL